MSSPRDSVFIGKMVEELEELRRQGLIDAATLERLRAYYGSVEGKKSSLLNFTTFFVTAFSVFGALFILVGIGLLLAFNWDWFSPHMRLFLGFLPLVICQLLALFVVLRRRDSLAWREGVGVALTLAIGCPIAVISQVYQIPGELYEFYASWLLLAAPVMYLLGSTFSAILFICGISAWWMNVPWWSRCPISPIPFYFESLAIVLPFCIYMGIARWKTWRWIILGWFFAPFLLISLQSVIFYRDTDCTIGEWILTTILASAFYLASKTLVQETRNPLLRPFYICGMIALLIPSLVLSLKESASRYALNGTLVIPFFAGCLGIAVTTIYLIWKGKKFEYVAPFLPFYIWVVSFTYHGGEENWYLYNFFALMLVASLLIRGFRENRLLIANVGLIYLAILGIMRFFDTNLSLWTRGMAFVLLGVAFIAVNILLIRRLTSHA